MCRSPMLVGAHNRSEKNILLYLTANMADVQVKNSGVTSVNVTGEGGVCIHIFLFRP